MVPFGAELADAVPCGAGLVRCMPCGARLADEVQLCGAWLRGGGGRRDPTTARQGGKEGLGVVKED